MLRSHSTLLIQSKSAVISLGKAKITAASSLIGVIVPRPWCNSATSNRRAQTSKTEHYFIGLLLRLLFPVFVYLPCSTGFYCIAWQLLKKLHFCISIVRPAASFIYGLHAGIRSIISTQVPDHICRATLVLCFPWSPSCGQRNRSLPHNALQCDHKSYKWYQLAHKS